MKIDLDLLDIIVTQANANEFINKLDELGSQLYLGDNSLKDKVNKLMSPPLAKIFMEAIYRNKIQINDPSEVSDLISLFQQTIADLPRISILLAVQFPVENLINLSKWFRIHTGKAVILDIQIKPELIGGSILMNQGQQRDYSLKKKLSQLMENDQELKRIIDGT